jgi:hypothetical protein
MICLRRELRLGESRAVKVEGYIISCLSFLHLRLQFFYNYCSYVSHLMSQHLPYFNTCRGEPRRRESLAMERVLPWRASLRRERRRGESLTVESLAVESGSPGREPRRGDRTAGERVTRERASPGRESRRGEPL